MNITECLNHLRPGAEWSLTNNDYTTLEWVGPGEAPTLAEVEAAWQELQSTPPPAPEAERYKVMEFLMRSAIPLESIPSLIESVTEAGIERDVAIMRWREVPTFPKNHPLVIAVAGELNLNLDAVWDTILAIE